MTDKAEAGFGRRGARVPKVAGDDELAQAAAGVKAAGKTTRRAGRKASQASGAHTSRAQQARAAQDIHDGADTPWVPPTSLEAPPPRPGMRQRWIRFAVFGRDDARNVAQKFREGWLPRKAETVPKNFPVPTTRSGTFAGAIVVEGSVLCEMPIKRAETRNAHSRRKARALADEIERNITKINRSIPDHAGFGRVTRQASTRVLTHAPDPVDAED